MFPIGQLIDAASIMQLNKHSTYKFQFKFEAEDSCLHGTGNKRINKYLDRGFRKVKLIKSCTINKVLRLGDE